MLLNQLSNSAFYRKKVIVVMIIVINLEVKKNQIT